MDNKDEIIDIEKIEEKIVTLDNYDEEHDFSDGERGKYAEEVKVNGTIEHFNKLSDMWNQMGGTFNKLQKQVKHVSKFTKKHRDVKAERKLERERKRTNRNARKGK